MFTHLAVEQAVCNVDFTRERCTRVHLFLSRLGYLGPAKDHSRTYAGEGVREKKGDGWIKGEKEKERDQSWDR